MEYRMEFDVVHNAGDCICFLSACREFARKTGNIVYVNEARDVVEAYSDTDHLRFGKEGMWFPISPHKAHRSKNPYQYGNYYGTFLAAMGIHPGGYPKPDLPIFPRIEGHCVIQPFSTYAENPPLHYIQGVVDVFTRITGMNLYVIGKRDTPKNLRGVKYDLLSDSLTHLMMNVQNSTFVLTPRSLTAHLAAGYGRPCFVWAPDDGENWHMDYSNWTHEVVLFKEDMGNTRKKMEKIISTSIVPIRELVLRGICDEMKRIENGEKVG